MSHIPVSPKANYRAKRGRSSTVSMSSAAPSRAASTISSRQGASTMSSTSKTSAPALATPPNLSIKQPTPQFGAYEHFNWSDEVDRNEEDQDEAPPTPTASSISVNLTSEGYEEDGLSSSASRWCEPSKRSMITTKSPPHRGRGRGPDGPVDPDQYYKYHEDDRPRTMAAAMEDLFDDDSFDDEPRAASVTSSAELWSVEGDVGGGSEASVNNNLWEGYDAPRQDTPTGIRRVKIPGEEGGKEDWWCAEHGPMCSPGICKARAKHERDIRWAKEKAKRDEERARRAAVRERNNRRRAQREAREAERDGAPRDKPPRRANISRGSCRESSGSGNSSDDTSGAGGCGLLRPQDERENTASPELRPPPVTPGKEGRTTEDVLHDTDDDTLSTTSSACRPWSVGCEEDDYEEETGEGDETQSVASARTSTTNCTSVSRRTGASSRSSAQRSAVSVRTNASPVDLTAAITAHAAQSSPTGKHQPASDTRSAASVKTTTSSRSEGDEAQSDASAHTSTTVWSNYTGVSRRTSASASSSAQRNAARVRSTASDALRSTSVETAVSSASEAGKKSGSRNTGRNRGKRAVLTQLEQAPLLEVDLPLGGPGNWGDPKVKW